MGKEDWCIVVYRIGGKQTYFCCPKRLADFFEHSGYDDCHVYGKQEAWSQEDVEERVTMLLALSGELE